MILIEMHMSNPGGRTQYIWAVGQPWPVPETEDLYVTRVEAFGAELNAVEKILPPGRSSVDFGGAGGVVDWLPGEAPYISKLMRVNASVLTK
jgi:hypothetical protein